MAFLVPRDPLTPTRSLPMQLAPGTRIVPAADVAAWTDAQGLLAAARAQAQAIVASAQEQLAQERAQAARAAATNALPAIPPADPAARD